MAGPGRLRELSEQVRGAAAPHLPPSPAVVALSGGADSAVCAWVALEEGRGPVRAVHVDHGLPASPRMARAARAVAACLGLELEEVQASVAAGASPEGRARAARYAALFAALEDGEALLVGHTADDQAETVLGNLLRGAGAGGLSGIPRRRGPIVRPILDVTRSETRELATLLGIPWREDPTNLGEDVRRNVIRRRLIPDLEARFNPGLRQSLLRTALLAAADDRLLEELAAEVHVEVAEGMVRVAASALRSRPAAVGTRVIRRAVRELRGPHGGTAGEVERVMAVVSGDVAAAVLAGAVRVEREGPWIVLRSPGEDRLPEPVELSFPGSAEFDRWEVEAWIEDAPPAVWPISSWVVAFDAEAVGDSGRVRPAGAGGRIPLKSGTKPLGECLAEAGVPPRLRPGWPVVETDRGVLWIPGVRSAPWGWVGRRTSRYLWVSAEGGRAAAGHHRERGEG